MKSIAAEVAHFDQQIKEILPEYQELTEVIKDQESAIEEISEEVHEVEDQVFAAFCKRYKLNNIREYEDRQLRFSEETSKRNLEFTTQIAKLENQLAFENEALSEMQERVEGIRKLIETEERGVAQYQKEAEGLEKEMDAVQKQIEVIKESVIETQDLLNEQVRAMSEIKKKISDLNKEFERANKDIVALVRFLFNTPVSLISQESRVESIYNEQFNILRKCKLEEIRIPLKEGSLADFGVEEVTFFRYSYSKLKHV
jgi:structural maintenance of chromosome 1